MTSAEHYHAVVVGSGFGGSVAAYRMAAAGLNVCVLERGKRYPPGSFPRSPRGMADNFWDPSDGRHGLYQVWGFHGIDGLVSAGLGGGSLIYANVHLRMPPEWFSSRRPDGSTVAWPFSYADLEAHYQAVESILHPTTYPMEFEPYRSTPKTNAYRTAAAAQGYDWSLPPISVTFASRAGADPIPGEPIYDGNGRTDDNLHHRSRYTCRLCGECDVGCNYGSKNTLDFNYLSMAERHRATLRDRCEVRSFAPLDSGGYVVRYVHHRPEDEGTPTDTHSLPVVEVTADRLVLAAGTFGTNFLMLKNKDAFRFSDRLGKGFSGNGDFLGLLSGASQPDGTPQALEPSSGPVITSTISVPDSGADGPGYYVQEGGIPAFFEWLLEVSHLPSEAGRAARFLRQRLHAMISHDPPTEIDTEIEALVGDASRSSSFLPLLGMGRDTPGGQFSVVHSRDRSPDRDRLELSWNADDSARYTERVRSTMQDIAESLGADFRDNPTWYLRKLITVHALGGCAVGTSPHDGVVDATGQVFGYPGFHIVDGSVLPGPTGPNPSLTIAALADRFSDTLVQPVVDRSPHG